MSVFLQRILFSVIDRVIYHFVVMFKRNAKIRKHNKQIDQELSDVVNAAITIQSKNLNDKPVTPEDLKRLKDANRKLSSNFFA